MKIIVVGSGAGGGTVSKELSKFGFQTTIIEKGPFTKLKDAYKN